MDARSETTILDLLRWIGWAQRKAGEDWIRARELSHEQGFVLGYLVQNPGAIQRDIAAVSRTSAASAASRGPGRRLRRCRRRSIHLRWLCLAASRPSCSIRLAR